MTLSSRNILILTLTIMISLFLKLLYVISSNNDLLFILHPVQYLVGLVCNTNSIYDTEIGYYFPALNIVINKSCAGINFWIISFCVAVTIWLKEYDYPNYTSLTFITLFGISYLFTLFVNTSRITTAILALQLKNIIPSIDTNWFHQAEGTFIYLFFLLLFSLGINKIFNKINITNAQRV